MASAKEFLPEKKREQIMEKATLWLCAMNFLLCVFVYYMHRIGVTLIPYYS
jgi:preprotein translocase subunit SecG